jgi:DNA-binding CsgD family transcriptional regulator
VDADRDARAAVPDPVGPRLAQRSEDDIVRSGAELVALSERFYGGVFIGASGFVGLAALAALAVLPVRSFPPGTPVTVAFVATGLIAVAAVLAVWRSRELYRALRRWPQLQLGLVLVAAALVANPAMSSALWWPSCAILMALALVVPLRTTLAYCLLVLGANLAGHLVAADLDETHAVDIIGLWIGYPLWLMAIAIVTDRLAAHVLRVNSTPIADPVRAPPRRVPAWRAEPAGACATGAAEVVLATAANGDEPSTAAAETPAGRIRRLTARQIQVAALLADGLRYREVAACLSISERQVQRHIAEAVTRLGLRNAYELAAVAVSAGLVPDAAATAVRG